jgi:ABC-2 type transport system ATP-binding protein
MTLPIAICANIEKTYPSGFHLSVKKFEPKLSSTTAILGKNGSGKSTFINILTGNLEAQSGQVLYEEKLMTLSAYKLKRETGYLPQKPELPPWTIGRDLLEYVCNLHKIKNSDKHIKKTAAYWQCTEILNKPVATYSIGMKKTLCLCIATIHNPKYLILDEPFSSLDISHINILEQHIKEREQNKLVTILSTHLLLYAATLSQEIYILTHGKLQKFSNKSNDLKDIITNLKIKLIN